MKELNLNQMEQFHGGWECDTSVGVVAGVALVGALTLASGGVVGGLVTLVVASGFGGVALENCIGGNAIY